MTEQPPLRDYAAIGDGAGAALVSTAGSIDWCCLERMDKDACFARILDAENGGACTVEQVVADRRRYLEDTFVLETELVGPRGRGRLWDCFDRSGPQRLLRIAEGVEGRIDVAIRIDARPDYGTLKPWVRMRGDGVATLQGGDTGVIASADADVRPDGEHGLLVRRALEPGERLRLALSPVPPSELDRDVQGPSPAELDRALAETIAWWRREAERLTVGDAAVRRSALVLRALTYEETGAIAAAPTTSLPEDVGGVRNWDYRFSWVRDSTFTARSLARIGMPEVADDFAHFVMRTAAGSADQLQVLYGLGGERHMAERELPLSGYRGSRPVRVGNGAARQVQHDEVGEIMQMCWRWHERGHVFDDDEWRFLVSVVERAAARWGEPDRGFWEWRPGDLHFVHSKAACWGAIDRGVAIAEAQGRDAPAHRWCRTRDEIGRFIDDHGFDRRRGTFVQAFERDAVDAVALMLPMTGFVAHEDERMRSTVDVIREVLDADGLLYRYVADDGLPGREGAFLACSFWLAECLARQGRVAEAREAFDRVMRTATPLGLFAEEADPATDEPLGNLPQGLTHLSHITAALALAEAGA